MNNILKEKINLRLSQLNYESLIEKGQTINPISCDNFIKFINTPKSDECLYNIIEPTLSLTKDNEIVAVWDIGHAKISMTFLKTGDVGCSLMSDFANFWTIYPILLIFGQYIQ